MDSAFRRKKPRSFSEEEPRADGAEDGADEEPGAGLRAAEAADGETEPGGNEKRGGHYGENAFRRHGLPLFAQCPQNGQSIELALDEPIGLEADPHSHLDTQLDSRSGS